MLSYCGSKQFSENVPGWLHNRPKFFIRHCLARLPPHHNIPKETINLTENGHFTVKSEDSNTCYNVNLKSEVMPQCSCIDWIENHLPCKHMLAIFNYFPQHGWHSLPSCYTSCPVFSIDVTFVRECDLPEQSLSDININKLYDVPTHQTKKSKNRKEEQSDTTDQKCNAMAQKCRSSLKILANMTYQTLSCETLEKMLHSLNKIIDNHQNTIPKTRGLVHIVPLKKLKHRRIHRNYRRKPTLKVSMDIRKQRSIFNTLLL